MNDAPVTRSIPRRVTVLSSSTRSRFTTATIVSHHSAPKPTDGNPFVWRMIFRDPPADSEIAALHLDIQRRASQAIVALVGAVRPGEQLIAGIERAQANLMLAEGIKAINNGLAAWWFEHRDVSRDQVVAVAHALLWTGLERIAGTVGDQV